MNNSLESLAGSLGLNTGNNSYNEYRDIKVDKDLHAVYAAEAMEAQKDLEGFVVLIGIADMKGDPNRSEEGFKEFVHNVIEKIKEFFRKIGAWFKNLFKKDKSSSEKSHKDIENDAETDKETAKVVEKLDKEKSTPKDMPIGEAIDEKIKAAGGIDNVTKNPKVKMKILSMKKIDQATVKFPIKLIDVNAEFHFHKWFNTVTKLYNDNIKIIGEVYKDIIKLKSDQPKSPDKNLFSIYNTEKIDNLTLNITNRYKHGFEKEYMLKEIENVSGIPFTATTPIDWYNLESKEMGPSEFLSYTSVLRFGLSKMKKNKSATFEEIKKLGKNTEKMLLKILDTLNEQEGSQPIVSKVNTMFTTFSKYHIETIKTMSSIFNTCGSWLRNVDITRHDAKHISKNNIPGVLNK